MSVLKRQKISRGRHTEPTLWYRLDTVMTQTQMVFGNLKVDLEVWKLGHFGTSRRQVIGNT